ncbi:MAG: alpha/beta hydrolase [Chloroflexota bacterium]|nr:alpha/beta hydrolase [Chloroflexota bacterium]
MSAIILQDEIVHYEVLGRGRPVLFLHGWVGSWRYWLPSMQAASINYRAYAIDMWGFGNTAKPANRYMLSQQLNLLGDFLDKMGIAKIAVVGHGLGAIVSLLFAEKNPTFIDRIMAVDMPLKFSQINPRLSQDSPTELADWLLGTTQDSEAARIEAPKADEDAIYHSLRHLESMDITEVPKRLMIPCLLVHGQDDPVVGAAEQDQISVLPSNFHYISFEGTGHFPMLDAPSKFNRLMTDFLTLPPGGLPSQLELKEEWKRRVR